MIIISNCKLYAVIWRLEVFPFKFVLQFNKVMQTYLIIFGIVALFFVLMSTRIIFKKGGEFRGTCASNNPALKNDVGECTMCGKTPTANCDNA